MAPPHDGFFDDEYGGTDLMTCRELVLDSRGQLQQVPRLAGQNDCGMVAWHMMLRTPEYPDGREIIVIANDITYLIGSFGVCEDMLFKEASEMARRLGIPRIYIAANSGARIGLAEEVKACYRIAWNSPDAPEKGFKYLYVTPDDYKKLEESINAVAINENGEVRYKITDVIGKQDSIGVENLRGSGMIAGETSDAYNEIVTISLCTCRTVGIGAYLVRLGQRTIQVF